MITGKQIKNGSVTGKDIKDSSLKTGDLSPDTVAALHGQTGSPGAPGLSALQIITTTKSGIAVGENNHVRIECPAGTALLSADAEWLGRTEAIQVGRPSANLRRGVRVLRQHRGIAQRAGDSDRALRDCRVLSHQIRTRCSGSIHSPSPSAVPKTSWNSSRLRTMLARNSGGLCGSMVRYCWDCSRRRLVRQQ